MRLSYPMTSAVHLSRVNLETGDITSKDADEEENVEDELAAQSLPMQRQVKPYSTTSQLPCCVELSHRIFCCRGVWRRWGGCSQGK